MRRIDLAAIHLIALEEYHGCSAGWCRGCDSHTDHRTHDKQ